MELSLEPARSPFHVRRADGHAVQVGEDTLNNSCVVSRAGLQRDWPEQCVEDVNAETADRLLQLQPAPEVVLLGTGERQGFVAAEVQARLLARGVGVECMSNAACARTFNLLLGEDRRVAALFLLS